jgi:hypothetical protein
LTSAEKKEGEKSRTREKMGESAKLYNLDMRKKNNINT